MSYLQDPRVLFAAERTLLAWNRTSLSLIAFGFVVERAGLLLQVLSPGRVAASHLALKFWLGVLFIALGALCCAHSAWQYQGVLRSLSAEEFPPGYAARWGLWVNGLVALFGLALAGGLVYWRG